MLGREYRVSTDREIKRILKLGKRMSVPECSLYMMPSASGHARVCVIVASGVSKNAVVRNRVKRQARDVLRRAVEDGRVRAIDVVVMIRGAAVRVNDAARSDFYRKFFERAGIISV